VIDEIILDAVQGALDRARIELSDFEISISKREQALATIKNNASQARTKVVKLESYIRENYGEEML